MSNGTSNAFNREKEIKLAQVSLFIVFGKMSKNEYITKRGSKFECQADKMREIVAMLGWLTLLYLVCVLSQSA